jgi:hypothetical protein
MFAESRSLAATYQAARLSHAKASGRRKDLVPASALACSGVLKPWRPERERLGKISVELNENNTHNIHIETL